MKTSTPETEIHVEVKDLILAYGDFVLIRGINFTVERSKVFIVMGGSGCGKSTLLRHLIGLIRPAEGEVLYHGRSLWHRPAEERDALQRKMGVLYQSGALWSALTLAENIAVPLEAYTDLTSTDVRELVSLKLSLVGLAGFEDYYPSEISGGMRKRAGLARALALDPDILLFDEPSAGLDPISARMLDDLILELKESLGATVVVVTHELASIFAIGDDAIFLDSDSKSVIARGNPASLLEQSTDPRVIRFLTRGERNERKNAP